MRADDGQLPLAIGWVLYAVLHSLLAGLRVKAAVVRLWPGFAPWYRLAYNGVALLTALPLLWLMRITPGAELWAWNGAWAWLGNGLAAAALLGAMQSSKAYAMNDFLGLGVLGGDKGDRTRRVPPVGAAPLRAPSLVQLRPGDRVDPRHERGDAGLGAGDHALLRRRFLAGGTEADRHPRRHLPRYRERVPGLLPLPWKYLRRDEADSFR
jgi:hypothetical protein